MRVDTIMPAAITPSKMAKNAFFLLIPNINAASAPDHAPVIGRGIPTNIARASTPY